tara:strand:+ start:37 stop:207 length:171 start_codon:yes stop_codon:yes gene_type:complete
METMTDLLHLVESIIYGSPPKRARKEDGTYKGDDPKTEKVNEAWVGGKAPKKGKKK